MAEVGIVINVKNQEAKSALEGIGDTAKTALSTAREAANGAGKAFKAIGVAGALMNQAMELGKKAFEIFRMAVIDTTTEAINFRKAGDPMIKWFKDTQREAQLTRARLGDVLLPILKGITDSFGAVTGSISGWIAQNRVLLGSNLISWLSSIASVLTNGVAEGVLLVSKVWNGWTMLIAATRGGIESFFKVTLDGVSAALGALTKLADAVGANGLGDGLSAASAMAENLGQEFGRSAAASMSAVNDANNALTEQERKIRGIQSTVQAAIGQAATNAQKNLAMSVVGTNKTLEEQKVLIDAAASKEKAAAAERDAIISGGLSKYLAARDAMRQKDLAWQESALTSMEAVDEASTSTAQSLGAALGGAFALMAEDAEAGAKAMMLAIYDAVSNSIMAYAAQAAAASAASVAGTPFIGPALAVGAAAATLAMVRGFLTKFHDGGYIGGGDTGERAILAQNNEYMMSGDEVSGMQKFIGRMMGGRSPATQTPVGGASAGGGGVTIINRMWQPNPVEEASMSMRQARGGRRILARNGVIGSV